MYDCGIDPEETIEETVKSIEEHIDCNCAILTIDTTNGLDGMVLYQSY